jgi:hypothetical protein
MTVCGARREPPALQPHSSRQSGRHAQPLTLGSYEERGPASMSACDPRCRPAPPASTSLRCCACAASAALMRRQRRQQQHTASASSSAPAMGAAMAAASWPGVRPAARAPCAAQSGTARVVTMRARVHAQVIDTRLARWQVQRPCACTRARLRRSTPVDCAAGALPLGRGVHENVTLCSSAEALPTALLQGMHAQTCTRGHKHMACAGRASQRG